MIPQVFRDLDEFPDRLRGGAVSIGNFDGVHRGHARLVERLKTLARRVAGPAVIFTFDPHPVRLLRPEGAPPPLTWTDRKAALLGELGLDVMVAFPTDEELLTLEPAEFFDRVVCARLGARALVEGPNFRFGRARAGELDVLRRLCATANVELAVVEPMRDGREYVSSSRVRNLLCDGNVGAANRLLTRPYRVRGMVTHGDARGVKIGFPTANLDGIDTLLPALGVYAGRARTPEGAFAAAINCGPNPTFGQQALKIEVHLLDFRGSLYGSVLEVDFLARLRDIRPFGSVEDLKQQLARDVEAVRRIAAASPDADALGD